MVTGWNNLLAHSHLPQADSEVNSFFKRIQIRKNTPACLYVKDTAWFILRDDK